MIRNASATLLVVLLTGLLGGCGIPDNTDVVPQGAGPSAGLTTGEESTLERSLRQDTTDRAQFVLNYLEAAAGDAEEAESRVRAFLAPGTRQSFEPQELRVIRLTEPPLVNPGSSEVRLRVQQVGIMRANGILDPSSSPSDISAYTLTVQEIDGGSGLYVTKMPQVMLLSVEALQRFYEQRTIYFWNRTYTTLVPDVRYLPLTVTREQQPTEIINWLTAGPAPWLMPAVVELPAGTKAIGNVPAVSRGKLQINLTGPGLPPDDDKSLDLLRRQLMWSLRPNLSPQIGLELRIDHQVQGTYQGTDYLSSNAAYRFGGVPQRFCVYNGRVHRLKTSEAVAGGVPAITNEVNRNVRSAALSSSGSTTFAALVTEEPGGRLVLHTGAAQPGQSAVFTQSAVPSPAGRPVWAVTPASQRDGNAPGVIAASGRLYSFTADDAEPHLVEWSGGPSAITAVSIAPDGQRIAVIAGGRLYLSVLTASGNSMQLGSAQLIRTQMHALTAVDWNNEGSVIVAGLRPDARVAIADVSIDGATQTERLDDLGTAKITHLVAYPANPASGPVGATWVAYVADRVAYNGGPVQIRVSELAAPAPSVVPGALLTAPFFLD